MLQKGKIFNDVDTNESEFLQRPLHTQENLNVRSIFCAQNDSSVPQDVPLWHIHNPEPTYIFNYHVLSTHTMQNGN